MNIQELLERSESEVFDRKRQFHQNRVELLHDILCLVNAYNDSDRYLLFGQADAHGHPDTRLDHDKAAETRRVERRKTIEENLAGRPIRDVVGVGSFQLSFVENDGLTRLGRLALAYISHMPRTEFAHAMATGVLAEAIQGYTTKGEFFAWVLRTAADGESLRSALFREIDELICIDLPKAISAARRLLRYEGSSKSVSRLADLPAAPSSDWSRLVTQHEADPCSSFFAWTREQCIHCLAREDIPIFRLVRHGRSYWSDPRLPKPTNLPERLQSLAARIDPTILWQQRNYSSAARDQSVRHAVRERGAVLFAPHIGRRDNSSHA